MDIPEHLHGLIEKLGEAIVRAMAEDPESRELARKIREEGFDVALMVEATVALHKRTPEDILQEAAPAEPEGEDFSEEDRALLRRFKIALD